MCKSDEGGVFSRPIVDNANDDIDDDLIPSPPNVEFDDGYNMYTNVLEQSKMLVNDEIQAQNVLLSLY